MWTTENTELHTWFERGRAHVELREKGTDTTIVEWWDEDVFQAVEDGFLDGRAFVCGRLVFPDRLHRSAVEYANTVGAA